MLANNTYLYRPSIEPGFCFCGCGERTNIPKKSNAHHGYIKGQPVKFLKGHGGPNKHNADWDFFYSINSEQQAYWLGFIAADGYINRSSLCISLGIRDISHIYKFKEAIRATNPVYVTSPKTGDLCNITISSRMMIRDLSQYGIVPQKTYTVPWPKLPNNLLQHYLRGYVDGDGCFSIDNFYYIANKHFASQSQKWLASQCNLGITKLIERKSQVNNPSVFVVCYGGRRQIEKISNFLYNNCTICLERKRQKARDIVNDKR